MVYVAQESALLGQLEGFLAQSFGHPIVWEQKDGDLLGKYVYLKYAGQKIGLFIGFYTNQSSGKLAVRAAVTFFFMHPSGGDEPASDAQRLFLSLLVRLNLSVKGSRYRPVAGKSPALIRTMHFGQDKFSDELALSFFRESIGVIKSCEPLYRAAS